MLLSCKRPSVLYRDLLLPFMLHYGLLIRLLLVPSYPVPLPLWLCYLNTPCWCLYQQVESLVYTIEKPCALAQLEVAHLTYQTGWEPSQTTFFHFIPQWEVNPEQSSTSGLTHHTSLSSGDRMSATASGSDSNVPIVLTTVTWVITVILVASQCCGLGDTGMMGTNPHCRHFTI